MRRSILKPCASESSSFPVPQALPGYKEPSKRHLLEIQRDFYKHALQGIEQQIAELDAADSLRAHAAFSALYPADRRTTRPNPQSPPFNPKASSSIPPE